LKKITVLIDEGGGIVASYIPPERPADASTGDEPPFGGLFASEGQQVLDLELPDEEVPTEPGPNFHETLQRYRDRGSS
jgi:hypothetical protein